MSKTLTINLSKIWSSFVFFLGLIFLLSRIVLMMMILAIGMTFVMARWPNNNIAFFLALVLLSLNFTDWIQGAMASWKNEK